MNRTELLARRAELLDELARLDEALKAFGPVRGVHIRTRRNLRNTGQLTTDAEYAQRSGMILVFSDEAMTTVCHEAGSEGYVAPEDAARIRMERLMGIEII